MLDKKFNYFFNISELYCIKSAPFGLWTLFDLYVIANDKDQAQLKLFKMQSFEK